MHEPPLERKRIWSGRSFLYKPRERQLSKSSFLQKHHKGYVFLQSLLYELFCLVIVPSLIEIQVAGLKLQVEGFR